MSNLAPGLSMGDIPGFRPQDDFDDDAFQEWAEDKAYEIIIDNLASYFVEYAERLEESILETFLMTKRDWSVLRDTNKGSVHLMLLQMSEWYVEENYDELIEEYLESRDDD